MFGNLFQDYNFSTEGDPFEDAREGPLQLQKPAIQYQFDILLQFQGDTVKMYHQLDSLFHFSSDLSPWRLWHLIEKQ